MRKSIKLQGVINIALGVILALTIVYAFTLHLQGYETYMDSLTEKGRTDAGWAVIGIVLLVTIGAIALGVPTLLTIIAGVVLLESEKCGKGTVIFGIVAKFLTAFGFVFFFSSCYGILSIVVFGVAAALTLAAAIYGIYFCAKKKSE